MSEREKLGARLDPVLREWADKVIIPALAREYFAQGNAKKIAQRQGTVTEFKVKAEPSAEVIT